MNSKPKETTLLTVPFINIHVFGVAITLCTFLFDIFIPLGVAAAVPHCLLVILSLGAPGRAITLWAALSASTLTLLGFYLSPMGGEMWQVVANRLIALLVIWGTAILCLQYKKKSTQADLAKHKLIEAEKMASLGQLAAGIAHELGNPIATIQGRLEILDMQLNEPTVDKNKVKKAAHVSLNLLERMTRIIRGMRSFARDGAHDPLVPTCVSRLIDDVLEISKKHLQKLGVEVKVIDFDSNLKINCRETQINQVLINLINNGKDAIEDLPEKWIRIEVIEKQDLIDVTITDSGPGIPEKLRPKVMEAFFTTKAVGKGTGLGLSISSSIINSHSGSLWLDHNHPNTRFVMTLPKAKDTKNYKFPEPGTLHL